jgi:two-component system OmpR family sensor kinase
VSLRARLLAGLVALAAVGLGVSAVTTYEEQRAFLFDRAHEQVLGAVAPISARLGVKAAFGDEQRSQLPSTKPKGKRIVGAGLAAFPPAGTLGELLAGGKVVRGPIALGFGTASRPLVLPREVPISRIGSRPRFFTVRSASSGLRYEAVAISEDKGNRSVVAAVPLREIEQTLQRLVVVEAVVGGGVIVALIVLGWLVIRLGLRPLERIGRVASEIAAGDFSSRVGPTNPRTEIGRLGISLNEMLVRIEEAFAARSASEDRLRRFIADASHELRTPLSSIRGYAELFRLGPAREPVALERAMARIEAEAERMGVLVEDLLLLARLDESPEGRRAIVDLCELLEQAASDARAVAPERDVSVQVSGRLEVLADLDQLHQVIANLVRNAVIHTPSGSPIELGAWEEPGHVVLEVRDHGPGLPKDEGDRVFDRFWRAEGGRSRRRGGAGLGLSIVEAIVKDHGGEVRAENAPAGGAIFRVRLPRNGSHVNSDSADEPAKVRAL